MNDIKVSVIVPIYNVEEYLFECLESIRVQTLKEIEVLMIDDGSTDHSADIAKEFDEKYENFHYYYKENGGLGNARNFAIPYIKGEYLIFVDSDDIVPDYAYEKMYNLAKETGNDMIIGNVRRFNTTKEFASPLHQKVFTHEVKKTHILEKPELVYDTTSWNKLFKTSFYKENNFQFPEKILYEDIPVTVPAHFKANAIGIVMDTCYLWRVRDGASKSITQDRQSIVNFTDRIKIMQMADDFYNREVNDPSSHLMKDFKWLDMDLKLYIHQLDTSSDEYNEVVFDEINKYLEIIDPKAFDMLRAIDKMKYEYIKRRDIQGLRDLLVYQNKGMKQLIISKKGNQYYGDYPMKDIDVSLKEVTHDLSYYPLTRTIRSVTVNQSCLNINFSAYIPYLKSQKDFKMNVYVCDKDGNKKFDVDVKRCASPYLKGKSMVISRRPLKIAKRDYDQCAYEISIDLNELSKYEFIDQEAYIKAEYGNGIVNNSFYVGGEVKKANTKNSIIVNGKVYDTDLLNYNYFRISFKDDCSVMSNITVEDLQLSLPENDYVINDGEDMIEFNKTLDLRTLSLGRHKIALNNGKRLSYNGMDSSILDHKYLYMIGKDDNLNLVVDVFKTDAVIDRIIKKDHKVELVVKANNKKVKEFAKLVLGNRDFNYNLELDATSYVLKDEYIYLTYVLDFSDASLFSNIAKGTYTITIRNNHVETFECLFTLNHTFNDLKLKRSRVEFYIEDYHLMMYVFHSDARFERTKRKKRLIGKYIYPFLRLLPINKNIVVFEGWWGAKYHCNPKYLYKYINENYPNKKCVWLLNDEHIPVDGNAIRVKRNTLKYYYYLSVGKYFVNNVNFADNYEKKKGQIEIQTMHGTPLKTLGLDVPGELDTPEKRNAFLRRRARWNYLVVQSHKASEITASCYAFEKEFLRTGYPRNDILFEKNNEKDINKLKEKMGLPLDKKVIMYAPTWRKRNYFDLHMDLERIEKKLSDEYILLLRVHPFAYPGFDQSMISEFVYDFSTYESVEELYLVSDVVITDYSSVMFDYTILNRPILLYTYDLVDYRDNLRGFNFDFENEAPGPLLETYDDLENAILNIDDTYQQYYDALQKFRAKFNEYENGNAAKAIYDRVFK